MTLLRQDCSTILSMTESLQFDFISVAGKQLTEHLTVVTGDALSILNVNFTFTRKNVQLCSRENSTFVYSQTIVPNITVFHCILLILMMHKDGFNHWFVFILALQFIQKQLVLNRWRGIVIISNVTSNDHLLPCSCVSFATCEQQKKIKDYFLGCVIIMGMALVSECPLL